MAAYGINFRGSDWTTILVKQTDGLQDLSEKLEWVKFSSVSWLSNRGFFYQRFPAPSDKDLGAGKETNQNLNAQLYYHQLGSSQDADILIVEVKKHPRYMFSSTVTEDEKYLIVTMSESTDPVNKLWIAEIPSYDNMQTYNFARVVDDLEAGYEYLGNDGPKFWFKTNKNAPKSKIVTLDLGHEVLKPTIEHAWRLTYSHIHLKRPYRKVLTYWSRLSLCIKTN